MLLRDRVIAGYVHLAKGSRCLVGNYGAVGEIDSYPFILPSEW